MSVIFGKWNYHKVPLDIELYKKIKKTLEYWKPDNVGNWFGDSICFIHLSLYNTPQSISESLPFKDSVSDIVITSDLRLDNRDELCHLLGISHHLRQEISDSQIIIKAYNKWGTDCPIYLLGAFAFVIWDDRLKRLFCARDQIGVSPFYYSSNNKFFAFSSDPKGLLELPDLSTEVSPTFILNILSRAPSDYSTFYKSIKKLPPAHTITIDVNGRIQLRKYWKATPDKRIKLSSDSEYVDAFRSLLHEAIQCRLRSVYPVGSQMSGGLDSSAISVIAHSQAVEQNTKLYTYSNILSDEDRGRVLPFTDDSERINKVLRFAKMPEGRKVSTSHRTFSREVKYGLKVQGYPTNIMFHNSDRIGFQAQKDDVRTMLSGFPGDHVVSSNGGGYMESHLKKFDFISLWKNLRLDGNQSIFDIIIRANRFLRKKLRSTKSVNIEAKTLLHPVYINEWKDFYVKHKLKQYESRAFSDEILCDNIMNPDVEQRMAAEALASKSYKIDCRYPLADLRLIEFIIGIPLEQKVNMGQGRLLFRRAMSGILPDEIRWEPKSKNIVIPYEYLHRQNDFEKISNLIFQTNNDPMFRFLNIELLQNYWASFHNIKEIKSKIRGSGKVLMALQLIYLLQEKPELSTSICDALKRSSIN